MEREASYYTTSHDGILECRLCPIGCRLKHEDTGICHSRQNQNGIMVLLNYGRLCALHVDPIEKKPLYHFLPGTSILSLGNNGCNLRCSFCQNWQISQTPVETTFLNPEQILQRTLDLDLNSVAFTYAEPSVWFEYVLDTAKLLHGHGIHVVLVTNGLINEEPFRELEPWIDAMNIDIKSMDPEFYSRLCKGPLDPVLRTCIRAVETCHVEITNLVIPGENDTDRNFHDLARFIGDNLGPKTPLHISRYHPSYHLSNPPTPLHTIARACEITREYLHFVYPGNVPLPNDDSTICPGCGAILIDRRAYTVSSIHLETSGACPSCGFLTGIITR
ncbi:AmmeMemoRadiSam system radical SAM enzyme [bacterium]|nr:AmmeMemoRadiSam system radical SAM enzyme [candidate division CSSED10-310 bacterium]